MNYKKLVLLGVGLFTLAAGALNFIPLQNNKAHAASTFTWVDAKTVTDENGVNYIFQGNTFGGASISDSQKVAVFVAQSKTTNCTINPNYSQKDGSYTYKNLYYGTSNKGGADLLLFQMGNSSYVPDGTHKVGQAVYIGFSNPSNPQADSACQTNNFVHVSVANPNNASSIKFNWYDSSTIVNVLDGTIYKNSNADHPTYFYATNSGICHPWIQESSTTSGEYFDSQPKNASGYTQEGNCYTKDIGAIQIGHPENLNNQGTSTSGPTNSSGGSNSADGSTTIDCGGGPLNWIVCPVVSWAQDGAGKLDEFISNNLTISASQTFNSQYYTAWNSFRILATALLVIAGLVMVGSQALGFDFLDAYTVRKTLPRLVVAIIGMSLSWPLLKFGIGLFNTIGQDVAGLITGPFSDVHAKLNASTVTITGLIAAAGSITAFIVYGPTILLLLVSGFLALFIAFIILVIRQIAVIVIVILAPIAIACYILPNTQKAWDIWKDNFFGLMLMYPIVMAFIAAGHAFAVIAVSTGQKTEQLIGIIAYFIPYFLLPLAFKLASGIIGTVSGMVNDRSKGVFDRMKKYRQGKASANIHAMKGGNRFKGDGMAANAFNATTRNAANLPNAGFVPWKMRSRMQAAGATHEAGELAEYMEKNPSFGSIKGNDDYLQATMKTMGGGEKESDWRRYLQSKGYEGRSLEQGVAQIREAKRGVSNEVFAKAAVMANASTGTGWKEGGVTQMMEAINDAAGGDRHTASTMLAQMRGAAGQAGRLDLAGSGFGVQATQLERMYQEKARTGSVSEATKEDVKHKIHGNLLETKGASEFARARGNAVQQIAPEMLHDLRQAHTKVSNAAAGSVERLDAERELAQKYASIANFHDSLNHMSPENAKQIADNVLSQKIYEGDTMNVLDRINEYRQTKNADYLATRKDYDARQYREQGGDPNDQG